jgi:hypothetical protein
MPLAPEGFDYLRGSAFDFLPTPNQEIIIEGEGSFIMSPDGELIPYEEFMEEFGDDTDHSPAPLTMTPLDAVMSAGGDDDVDVDLDDDEDESKEGFRPDVQVARRVIAAKIEVEQKIGGGDIARDAEDVRAAILTKVAKAMLMLDGRRYTTDDVVRQIEEAKEDSVLRQRRIQVLVEEAVTDVAVLLNTRSDFVEVGEGVDDEDEADETDVYGFFGHDDERADRIFSGHRRRQFPQRGRVSEWSPASVVDVFEHDSGLTLSIGELALFTFDDAEDEKVLASFSPGDVGDPFSDEDEYEPSGDELAPLDVDWGHLGDSGRVSDDVALAEEGDVVAEEVATDLAEVNEVEVDDVAAAPVASSLDLDEHPHGNQIREMADRLRGQRFNSSNQAMVDDFFELLSLLDGDQARVASLLDISSGAVKWRFSSLV